MSGHIIKARALEVKVRETEAEVYDARLQIRELKDKYSSSKQYSLECEEETKSLRAEIEELGGKLKMAEHNPIIIPEVSRKIIEDYKASEDFYREVVEGSTDGFSKGFELCRSQIQNFFPNFDISQLKEFSDDDDDEVEAEVRETEGATEEVAEASEVEGIGEGESEVGEMKERRRN